MKVTEEPCKRVEEDKRRGECGGALGRGPACEKEQWGEKNPAAYAGEARDEADESADSQSQRDRGRLRLLAFEMEEEAQRGADKSQGEQEA